MPIVSKSPKSDKAQELRQRIDKSIDALAKAVDDVRASEMFTAYLRVQARFHKYSWRNSMLIAMQRPDATQIAGYRAWQKLKRQVRKGECGTTILAPCPFKRDVERNGETETEEGMFFRAVHVFDVAQTDGPDLPTVDVPTIEAQADDLLAKLQSVAVTRGIRVVFGPIPDGAFGVSHKDGRIEIEDSHPTGQQAKTLEHELAHQELHHNVKGPLTRSIAELEAESVAYVVCMRFGLDVEVRASRYIALWDGDSKALRSSLERIAKTARALIDDVEAVTDRKAVA